MPYIRMFGKYAGIQPLADMRMRMRWDIKEILSNLSTMPKVIQMGARQGLMDAGNAVLEEAFPLVPKETGALAYSGTVVPTGLGETGRMSPSIVSSFDLSAGSSSSIMVQYNTPYATYVHEDPLKAHGAEYNAKYPDHPQKEPQEQYNWMPEALKRAQGRIEIALRSALSKSIQRVLKNPRRWGFDPSSSAMSDVRQLADTYGARPRSFGPTGIRPGATSAMSNYGSSVSKEMNW